jgi:hypothetical protein
MYPLFLGKLQDNIMPVENEEFSHAIDLFGNFQIQSCSVLRRCLSLPEEQSYQSFSISSLSILRSGAGLKLIIRHYKEKIRQNQSDISQKSDTN